MNYTLSFQHEVAADEAKLPATRLPANVAWQSWRWLECWNSWGFCGFWMANSGKSKKMQRFLQVFWVGILAFATEFLEFVGSKAGDWSVGQAPVVEVPVPSNLSQARRGRSKIIQGHS